MEAQSVINPVDLISYIFVAILCSLLMEGTKGNNLHAWKYSGKHNSMRYTSNIMFNLRAVKIAKIGALSDIIKKNGFIKKCLLNRPISQKDNV